MGIPIERREDYPAAPVYVWAKDWYLSGASEAKGRDSVYVVGCASEAEAAVVFANFTDRGDMEAIRKGPSPPEPAVGTVINYLDQSTDPGSRWFVPGSMKIDQAPVIAEATDQVRIMLRNSREVTEHFYWLGAFDDVQRRLENYVRVQTATPGTDFDKNFKDSRSMLDFVSWSELAEEAKEEAQERGYTQDEALRRYPDLGDREPFRFEGL
jgi:hypothetical protein